MCDASLIVKRSFNVGSSQAKVGRRKVPFFVLASPQSGQAPNLALDKSRMGEGWAEPFACLCAARRPCAMETPRIFFSIRLFNSFPANEAAISHQMAASTFLQALSFLKHLESWGLGI